MKSGRRAKPLRPTSLFSKRPQARLILTCLCLILLLPGLNACTAKRPQQVEIPVAVPLLPPAALYQDSPLLGPPAGRLTRRTLAAWTADLLGWCGEAKGDRAALRLWAEEQRAGGTQGAGERQEAQKRFQTAFENHSASGARN